MIHQTWGTKVDYWLTVVGYSVGVGSMWKWPYLCMRNGGGAFVIPFILFTIIGTIPCVYMEMTIGQYSQSGAITVWNLCPPFRGIGLGGVLISWFFDTCYPVLIAWFLYYLYHSFSTNIPWAYCGNNWNTPTCISQHNSENKTSFNAGNITTNSSVGNATLIRGMTAAEEFWRFNVLEMTDSLVDIGGLRGVIVGCLAITYIGIFFCMFHGIKVSGKVVYFTVTCPYILLTVFLIRGCLLPGSADGIYYYIYPKFEKLLDPKMWVEACGFALYNMGVAWGCLITMSGHNKLNNNCFRDAVLVTLTDLVSTLYCGFAFFSIMGHVAHLRGVTVEAFQSSGYNLGFIVYPEAVASLPLPQLWSALTFVLLLTLGIDSLVPGFEIVVTAATEQFPKLTRRRWIINLIVLLPTFLISLVYTSQGGIYVLTLVDWYATFPSFVVFVILECIVVGWIYGTDRLNEDVMVMWGKKPPRVVNICLKFVCPVLLLILFSYALYSYRAPKYAEYVYPGWATGIGWIITFSSIIPIPVIFVCTVYRTQGNTLKEKLQNALKPNKHWGYSAEDTVSNQETLKIRSFQESKL